MLSVGLTALLLTAISSSCAAYSTQSPGTRGIFQFPLGRLTPRCSSVTDHKSPNYKFLLGSYSSQHCKQDEASHSARRSASRCPGVDAEAGLPARHFHRGKKTAC